LSACIRPASKQKERGSPGMQIPRRPIPGLPATQPANRLARASPIIPRSRPSQTKQWTSHRPLRRSNSFSRASRMVRHCRLGLLDW